MILYDQLQAQAYYAFSFTVINFSRIFQNFYSFPMPSPIIPVLFLNIFIVSMIMMSTIHIAAELWVYLVYDIIRKALLKLWQISIFDLLWSWVIYTLPNMVGFVPIINARPS